MKKTSIILGCLVAVTTAFAQDENPPVEMISVVKGIAIHGDLSLPVFGKASEVEKSRFNGIRYAASEKTEKAALKKADEIKRFYAGKKIGGAKVGKFTKISKPDTVAWAASGKKADKVYGVVIKVEGSSVIVYVLIDYEESVQAMIL